jgi:hypothetical protein
MYWRSLSFYRDACSVLLAIGLTIFLASWLPAPVTPGVDGITADSAESDKVEELSFTSSDFAPSYPCAKNESVDHTICFSLHCDRLIRSSVLYEIQIELLTEKLILIAQVKLTI